MPNTKTQARIGPGFLILVCLPVVSLATGAPARGLTEYTQIDFTPDVSTLVVTPTPLGPRS